MSSGKHPTRTRPQTPSSKASSVARARTPSNVSNKSASAVRSRTPSVIIPTGSKTTTGAKTPSKSAPKTPSKTPSSTIIGNRKIQHACEQYTQDWIDQDLATDPVHSSEETLRDSEDKYKLSIQPYNHSSPLYFPSVAKLFGLERVFPSGPLYHGGGADRGPKCEPKGEPRSTICHKQALPAFFYQIPNVKCTNTRKAKTDCLIFRWYIANPTEEDPITKRKFVPDYTAVVMKPMACWYCHIKGLSPCFLITSTTSVENPKPSQRITEILPLSNFGLATSASVNSLESEEEHKSSDLTPLARCSTEADFELPPSKRRETSISPTPQPHRRLAEDVPPVPPLPTLPPVRPSRAYREGLRAASRAKSSDSRVTSVSPAPFFDGPADQHREHYKQSKAEATSFSSLHAAQSHPSLPASSVSKVAVESISVTPGRSELTNLRQSIDLTFEQAVAGAKSQFEMLATVQKDSKSILDNLFGICARIESRAQTDRQAIEDVREERDRHQQSLNAMDNRLVVLRKERISHQQDIQGLKDQVERLEKELKRSQYEQTVIEERMADAVEARAKADEECKLAKEGAQRDRDLKEKQDVAMADLYDELDAQEASLARQEAENAELKRQIAWLTAKLEESRNEGLVTSSSRARPTSAAAVPIDTSAEDIDYDDTDGSGDELAEGHTGASPSGEILAERSEVASETGHTAVP